MKRIYISFVSGLLLAACVGVALPVEAQSPVLTSSNFNPRNFGSTLEMHVADDGKLVIHGARVEQLAGNTFYAKMYWGTAFLRMTVRTNEKTKFTKRFGQEIGVKEIAVGDYVSIEGDFFSGSNSFDITARTVKNWSLQTEEDVFSGNITGITSVSANTGVFTLAATGRSPITLKVSPETVITRGSLTVTPTDLAPGKKVLSAIGVYNHVTSTLEATSVKIYQDMSIFKPRNFEGKVKSTNNSTSLPAVLIVTIGGKDYTVSVPAGSKVLTAKWGNLSIARFLPGDKVRLYGSIPESDTALINATVIRNLSF